MSNMFNARLKVLTVSEIEAAFGSKMVRLNSDMISRIEVMRSLI